MKCPSCENRIIDEKFCPKCGADLSLLHESKSQADFTVDWVREIFLSEKLSVTQALDYTNGERAFYIKDLRSPQICISFRAEINILLFTFNYVGLRPSKDDGERREFLEMINDMNANTICAKCSVDEEDASALYIDFAIYIGESISRADILSFHKFCNVTIDRVLADSKFRKWVA